MRRIPFASAILLALLVAAPARAEDPAAPAPATVPAKRYRTVVSGCEGRYQYPIDELWLPGPGVVVNVESRFDPVRSAATKQWESEYVGNVFFGPIRSRYAEDPLHAPDVFVDAPTEDVRVDAALAKKIAEAAELHRRLEAARREIGAALEKAALLPNREVKAEATAPPAK